MDLSSDAGSTRRNSFTSQQNIAHDIISDIYVTSDVPHEFSTFTTDISLIKGVGLAATAATAASATTTPSNHNSKVAANKRSYSVDTIKFQYPQLQQQQPSASNSSSSPTQQQQQQLPPSLASIAARKQRQRSQSAQYLNTSLVKTPLKTSESQQLFKSEENLKEDVNEEEFIDSLIAEYSYSQDDFNNNNNNNNSSYNNLNNDGNEGDDEGGQEDEEDGDLTQVSSFDDDCYVLDVHGSMRKDLCD